MFQRIFSRLVYCGLVIVLLRACTFEIVRVNDDSMAPTFFDGDLVMIDKLAYGLRVAGAGTYIWQWRNPAENDVVLALDWGDPPIHALRRVVSLRSEAGLVLGKKSADGKVSLNYSPVRMQNLAGIARYVLRPKEILVNFSWRKALTPVL